MTDTKAMQEGVQVHGTLAMTDFAEIERRMMAHLFSMKPLRPLLRRFLPAGKRISTAIAYGMPRKKIAKEFPFSYFVWKLVPQKPWRAGGSFGGYTGYAKGPKDWLHSGELVYPSTPMTGRWPSSQYTKSNAPKTYGGKLSDYMIQLRNSEAESPDAQLPDGTFLQFKHGEPGPTGFRGAARKSQIDLYKQAAARLVDDTYDFTGDPRAALYAPYGEDNKED